MASDDRHFAPAARYACTRNSPRTRWHDERTGQEHWRDPVGVDTLLDAGATLDDPDDVKLPYRVEIGPYQPPEPRWQVEINYSHLDVREKDDGYVDFVTTRAAVASEVFDDRDDAVDHACAEVDGFADADVRDAVAWRERRHDEKGDETADDSDTTEQATLAGDGDA